MAPVTYTLVGDCSTGSPSCAQCNAQEATNHSRCNYRSTRQAHLVLCQARLGICTVQQDRATQGSEASLPCMAG